MAEVTLEGDECANSVLFEVRGGRIARRDAAIVWQTVICLCVQRAISVVVRGLWQ